MAELAIPSLDIGADGFVAGPANVYPNVLSTIYDTFCEGDRQRAIELWRAISNPVVEATRPLPTAIGLKYLLRCNGRDVGEPLPPLSAPSAEARRRLDEHHHHLSCRYEDVSETL